MTASRVEKARKGVILLRPHLIWPGIALLLLGGLMLLGQLGVRIDGLVPAALGGVFLYLWHTRGRSWTLIVGCLIASRGLADMLSSALYPLAPHMPADSILLGAGFLAIYAQAGGRHRWSLWVGGTVTCLALVQWIARFRLFGDDRVVFWGVVLLAAGAATVAVSLLRRREKTPPPPLP